MNTYLVIPFVSFCVQLIALVYGLVLKRRGRIYLAFVLVAALFAGWAFTDLLLWLPVPEQYVDTVLRIQIPFYAFSGIAYLYLVYFYLHRNNDFLLIFFAAFSILAVLVGLPSDLVVAGYSRMPWGYALDPGPMHLPAATVGALVPYTLALYLLANRAFTSSDRKERRELFSYVASLAVLVSLAFATFIIAPGLFQQNTQPITHLVIILLQALNIYAIFRYQLLSIGIETAANELFADATDGIVILSNNNRIVQANNHAVQILAEDFPDSLEVTVKTLVSLFDRNPTGRTEIEAEVEQQDGQLKTIALTLSPVIHEGEPTGKLLQVRDVSQQKKVQQEILDMNMALERARDEALSASQAKSRFLANMSHELRTPLNAIIGYSEMLREQLEHENSPEHVADVDRIHLAGNHLLSVINNILDLSKIEAGKIELNIDNFTVGGLTRMVSAMVEPSIMKNGNRFLIDCPDTVGDMQTDVMKLRQSLINILGNAGRFTHDGEVELTVRRVQSIDGDTVIFSIRDTGIGIKPENLGRIFETFSQADDETTRLYGGSGLGLAISRRLVEILGGEISVESEPDQGSCFTIRVPATFSGSGGEQH